LSNERGPEETLARDDADPATRWFVTELTPLECTERLRTYRKLGWSYPPGIRALCNGRTDEQGFKFDLWPGWRFFGPVQHGYLFTGAYHRFGEGVCIRLDRGHSRGSRIENACGCATFPFILLAFLAYRIVAYELSVAGIVLAVLLLAIGVSLFFLFDRLAERAVRNSLSPDPFRELFGEVFDAVEVPGPLQGP
jgi:hypothetical protein